MSHTKLALFLCPLVLVGLMSCATASGQALATTLPPDFPAIKNPYLGVPVLGFGASGRVVRVPVIFLHGNNDTPYPTPCNRFGYIHNAAQYFLEHG
jgi:hypothetical protein